MGTDATGTRRWSVTAAGFGADVYLFTLLSLAIWVVLPTLVLGWSPILVSSGSMAPAIEAGDLVLIDEDVPTEPIAPGAIITYREPGRDLDRLVTHRIRDATDTGVYTTRGDANIVDDARPVPHDQIVGHARLLVPLLGLPIHWTRTDAQPALLAFIGLTALALAFSAAAARQDRAVDRHLDAPESDQLSVAALLATVTSMGATVDRPNPAGREQDLLFPADPAPAVERSTIAANADTEPLFAPDREPALRDGSAGHGADTIDEPFLPALFGEHARGRHEPSLWGTDRSPDQVPALADARVQAADAVAPADRTPPSWREQRARAARRKAFQPVLFLLVAAGLIAGGASLPETEAALTATVPNIGNVFATAPADPGGEPLSPELVLPPVDGQPSFPAGQQPETITFDLPVEGETTLRGAAEAVLSVRPSTRGNPPRSIGVTLRHGAGEVLAETFLEQQGWDDDWTDLTLTLEPELDVTLPAGDTLTVEIEVRRLELELDGGSIVRFPVVNG